MGTYGTSSNRPLCGGALVSDALTVMVKNMFPTDCIKEYRYMYINLPSDLLLPQVFHSLHPSLFSIFLVQNFLCESLDQSA